MSPKHHSRNLATASDLILQQLCKVDYDLTSEIRKLRFTDLILGQGYTELLKCRARIQTQIFLTPDLVISLTP